MVGRVDLVAFVGMGGGVRGAETREDCLGSMRREDGCCLEFALGFEGCDYVLLVVGNEGNTDCLLWDWREVISESSCAPIGSSGREKVIVVSITSIIE